MSGNLAYLYSTGDEINGEKQFQQLVTIDTPDAGLLSDAIVTQKGLTLKYTDNLYYLPMPGLDGDKRAYLNAPKMQYKWKSKKFVFPGRITLAAAKIVHDCGSAVTFNLYVDCRLVYTVEICDCLPFRLPPNIMGNEVEIEVIGKSPIHKIKVASSMQELIEHE
jgi:hypothetical protein